MKFFKKIISAVCAIGMIATMTSALAAESGTVPTVQITLNDGYNEETGEGTLSVHVLNIDKTVTERPEDLFVASIQFGIKMPSDIFDDSYYSTGKGGQLTKNVVMAERFKGKVTGPTYQDDEYLRVTFAKVATDSGEMLNSYNGDDISDIHLMDINFKKISDEPVDMKALVGDVKIITRHYDASWSTMEAQYKYGNIDADTDNVYDFPVIGEIVVEGLVIPAATGATATGDQLLNLEPSDVGLGDKWTQDPDYATEDAVVSLANVKKDDAITGFTWEIKAADAEGNPLASEKTKKYFGVVGGLETGAEVTVGLVVGYDTTEWQSVEIVGVTAE